jgi:hypothetical protein
MHLEMGTGKVLLPAEEDEGAAQAAKRARMSNSSSTAKSTRSSPS